jgi:hypothetical protein
VPEETVEEQELTSLAKGATSIGKILMVVLLAVVSSAAGGVISFVLISRTLNLQARGVDNPDKTREAEQEFEKSIKQTKAEVKEDTKATGRNPGIKGKIKSSQRTAGRWRMMTLQDAGSPRYRQRPQPYRPENQNSGP